MLLQEDTVIVILLMTSLECYCSEDMVIARQWKSVGVTDGQALSLDVEEPASSAIHCAVLCSKRPTCRRFCHRDTDSICQLVGSWAPSGSSDVSVKCYVTVDICPESLGYAMYGDVCIKLYTTRRNYADAKTTCGGDNGAHLYHLKSKNLDGPPLRQLLQKAGFGESGAVWLGADDIAKEGKFVWSDGTQLPTNSDLWMPHEPNDGGGDEDCAQYKIPADGVNDTECSKEIMFVCQLDM